ncbi:MAG: hypothetical protein O3A63_01135, partial [Proteobacteria bacterium]|nr:hypothetical protein [Pseudomonadota bacterium]
MQRQYKDRFTLIRGTLCAGTLGALMMGLAGAAHAQIDLTNSVKKVVSSVGAGGDVLLELVPAESVVPGDELRYTITFTNSGTDLVDARSVVITNPIPENTVYLEGTAFGTGTQIVFSIDSGETFAGAEELSMIEDGVEVP